MTTEVMTIESAEKVIDNIIKSPDTLNAGDILKYCTEAGITIEFLFNTIKEGLSAEKIILNKMGEVTGTIPDFTIRHDYLKTTLDLLRIMKDKKENTQPINLNVTVNHIDVDERLSFLRN